MNKSLKSFFYKMGILFILIILVVIYDYFTEKAPQKNKTDTESPAINYFASDIHMIQYQENGTIQYQMTAEKMLHVEQTDIAYLTNPTAHIYKDSVNPWFIRSDKGEVGPKGEAIKLINNVRGTQVDEKGQTNQFDIGQQKNTNDPTKYGITMVYPNKKYAESKDFTVISSADGQSSGVGVKAYFEQNRLQLLSKVQTKINKGSE